MATLVSTTSLIYGKDDTQNIVSLEVKDDVLELFIQDKNGDVRSEFRKNKFWVTSNRNHGGFSRLKGDLHYKFGKQFTTLKDYYEFRNTHRKDDIYAISDPKEAIMVKDGYTQFKGLRHNEVTILSFDIETTGLTHDSDSKVIVITNTFRKNGVITRKLFGYCDYPDQAEMLNTWVQWVNEINPTIITGHNIVTFDFPYIQYVADCTGVALNLGRDGSPLVINRKYEAKFRVDGARDMGYHKVKIFGREVIDTMFLAYRYDIGKKYESYGLKPIIKQEGLEVKDRVFYDASKIRTHYHIPEEWEKIKAYAIFDADDSLALYDLMAPAQFYWTQKVPKPFQVVTESATGAQINSIMVRSYLQEGHSLPAASPAVPYEGAISFGVPGIYNNMMKIDFAALYPSIMVQYEVYNKKKDPNGNFLLLVKALRDARLKNKELAKSTGDKYYTDLEQAEKIGANSLYGSLGTTGLLFNSPDLASFVTEKGRDLLKESIMWATGKDYSHWRALFEEKTK